MLLAILLSAVQVEPPETVNGDVLGPPERYATVGPAQVCMRNMMVKARKGETVYLQYAGIHAGTLRLVSDGRYVEFEHLESGSLNRSARPVGRGKGYDLFRTVANRSGYTALFDTKDPDEYATVVRVGGSGLTGERGRRMVFDRLSARSEGSESCDRTYAYGWDMLFGEEPLSREAKP